MERSVQEQLLYMLQNLGEEELKHFHWYLQNVPVGDFTTIRKCHLEKANRLETIDLMVQTYTTDHVIELATSILEMMSQGQSEKRDTQHSNAVCRHNIILSFSEEPTQGNPSVQAPSLLSSEETLQKCQPQLKANLRNVYQYVFEGIAKAGDPTLLNQIYTELYITEGGTTEVNMNMRSDRLKVRPGNQTDQKQQSDKKTSLKPHLE
ncbi:uncharacterized protein LOC120747028 [Simochromis diagramma]|uniref:uncharacterized protein LOC120747028 n=1 Tax=Simochromis diagramma TaxID=43689 RepID=UPI001A7E98A5|nr:uncharacterized protein LOC120747028 [Simochromis diagramma]